jgi:lipooligosaccharide transport system ATP-binding protein
MDHGKILAEGAPLELVENFVGRAVIEIRGDEMQKERARQRLRGRNVVVEDSGDTLYIFSRDHADLKAELAGLEAERVVQRNATLEDVFLKLTGHVLQE